MKSEESSWYIGNYKPALTLQTNEEKTGSLHEKEFRIMIVKMLQNLGIECWRYKKRLKRT